MGNGVRLGISDGGLEGDAKTSGVSKRMGSAAATEDFHKRHRVDYKFWTPGRPCWRRTHTPSRHFNPTTHCTKTVHWRWLLRSSLGIERYGISFVSSLLMNALSTGKLDS